MQRLLGKPLGRPTPTGAAQPVHFEAFEPRLLLSSDLFPHTLAGYLTADGPLGDGLLGDMADGMDEIADLAGELFGFADLDYLLDVELPGLLWDHDGDGDDDNDTPPIAPTLGDALNLPAVLGADSLSDLVNDLIGATLSDQANDVGTGSVAGATVAQAIEDAINGFVEDTSGDVSGTVTFDFESPGGGSPTTGTYLFDVDISISNARTFDFDFGRNADIFRLSYFGDDLNQILANLPEVEVSSSINLQFGFGIEADLEEFDDHPDEDVVDLDTEATTTVVFVEDMAVSAGINVNDTILDVDDGDSAIACSSASSTSAPRRSISNSTPAPGWSCPVGTVSATLARWTSTPTPATQTSWSRRAMPPRSSSTSSRSPGRPISWISPIFPCSSASTICSIRRRPLPRSAVPIRARRRR